MNKTCRNNKFTSLITVERNSTNIEQKKERALKKISKFGPNKYQFSHRIDKTEDLVEEPDDERKKKCISIGPTETKKFIPIKLSFSKETEERSKSIDAKPIMPQEPDLIVETQSIDKEETECKRKREDVKSTPRNEDFLPDFGCNMDGKIKSENDRVNPHQKIDKISLSGRPIRSSSKRSSFEIKLGINEKGRKQHLNILSSSNSSRSKSREKNSLALTMNPISTTNFKYAIGNLPIKVSSDDMLFSFRNQVTTNRSVKESESSQLSEAINSRHGEVTYFLTSLEDSI